MYSVFTFDATYRTGNGRERTAADMLDAVKYDQNAFFMLTEHYGDFITLNAAYRAIRDEIQLSHYQSFLIGWNEKLRLWEHEYDGVIIYEDNRPLIIYGKEC